MDMHVRHLGTVTMLLLETISSAAWAAERLQLPAHLTIDDRITIQERNKSFPASEKISSADRVATADAVDRNDEIIVGKEVVINDPIRTNGGNVVIIADILTVNAPIDTRFRSPINIVSGDKHEYDIQMGEGTIERQVFEQWYLWGDYWDGETKSFKYRVFSQAEASAKSTYISILPYYTQNFGFRGVPFWTNKPVDGETPPAVDRQFVRSGSIYIYARQIRLCSTCARTRVDERPVSGGDPFDQDQVRLLVASGAKGGRGSLGSPHPCEYEIGYGQPQFGTPPCNEGLPGHSTPADQYEGGNSGAPGRGGDAGDIKVVYVSNPSDAAAARKAGAQFAAQVQDCAAHPRQGGAASKPCDLEGDLGQSLAALSDVSGGNPSHTAVLHTPRMAGITADRSVFKPVQDVSTQSLFGEAGAFQVAEMSASEAIAQVGQLLTSLDTQNHDLTAAAQVLSGLNPDNAALPSLVARDILDDFLNEAVVDRQVQLLDNTAAWVHDKRGGLPYRVDFFSTLRCSGAFPATLLDNESEDIRRLCELRLHAKLSALQSYLLSTDGLLSLPSALAAPDTQAAQVIAQLQQANIALGKIGGSASRIETLIFDRFSADDKASFLSLLSTLQARLQEAQDKLAKAADTNGRLFKAVKDCSEAIGVVIAAYVAANYVGAAAALPNAVSKAGSVVAILNNEDVVGGPQTEVALARTQLEAAKAAYEAFITRTNAYKEAMVARGNADVRDALNARRMASTQGRAFSSDFEALLKYAITNYAATPSNSEGPLLTPLRSIREAITRWPSPTVASYPARPSDRCLAIAPVPLDHIASNVPLTCVSVHSTSHAVLQSAGKKTKISGLPLIVIRKGDSIASLSYGGFLRKSDLVMVRAPSTPNASAGN